MAIALTTVVVDRRAGSSGGLSKKKQALLRAFQASKGKVDYSLCPPDAMDEVEARPLSENVYRSGLLAKRCAASITTAMSMIIRLG